MLADAANALGSLNAAVGLRDALQRGDTLGALHSGAVLARDTLRVLDRALQGQIAGVLAAEGSEAAAGLIETQSFVNGAANGLAQAIPYLSLINAISHRDGVGAATSGLAILDAAGWSWAGPVGWFISIAAIAYDILKDDPEPWAAGVFWSERDGRHVFPGWQGRDGGEATMARAMNKMLAALEATIADAPDMGLVARRLPWLQYIGDAKGRGSFTMYWKDPVTGEVRARAFDQYGNLAGDPTNPEVAHSEHYFEGLVQQFVQIAYDAGAVAPSWMVRTVDRMTNGLSETAYIHAGLTALQRAGSYGLLLPTDPGDASAGGAQSTQSAGPIVLDLDGDGITVTRREAGGGVLFDVDDDGFAEETDWISPREGILVLDRNGDGRIAGGHEMFSDSRVSLWRELLALEDIDTQGDRWITAQDDPAFEHLRVWQDINHDGQIQEHELSTLAQRGITELSYWRAWGDGTGGQFIINGVARTMATTPLQADSAGYITQMSGNSLLVLKETGERSLLPTALYDFGNSKSAAVRAAHTHASADGSVIAVDELMDGLEDTPIIVSIDQLLGNDQGGSARSFSALIAAVGGAAAFDPTKRTVSFTPDANFSGTASFSYGVADGNAQTSIATAFVDVAAVNDAPVASNTTGLRSAGWADVVESSRIIEQDEAKVVDVDYALPQGALLGDFVDGAGIVAFAKTEHGDGLIGFKEGAMYWGAGWFPMGFRNEPPAGSRSRSPRRTRVW